MLIRFLQAANGDAILISVPAEKGHYHVLIDGGPGKAYHQKSDKFKFLDGDLKKVIKEIRNKSEVIDLLILTHVDDDHIGGLLKWFELDDEAAKLVKKVWFNSGKLIAEYLAAEPPQAAELTLLKNNLDTGISQGVTFECIISKAGIWGRRIIKAGDTLPFRDMVFRFISPGVPQLRVLLEKWEREAPDSLTAPATDYSLPLQQFLDEDELDEDDAPHNGSSLAFILTYHEKNILFLGDGHPGVLVSGLAIFGFNKDNPLKAELVKLSHHGSCRNLSLQLLEVVESSNFVISSDGSKYGLPDKRCLARIIKTKESPHLLFNYPDKITEIFTEDDRKVKAFRTSGTGAGFTIDDE
jgi:beta-lactamase superfamily II metal-dependent hydrolase